MTQSQFYRTFWLCTTAIRRLCKNWLILLFQKTWANKIPVGDLGASPSQLFGRGDHRPHGVGAYVFRSRKLVEMERSGNWNAQSADNCRPCSQSSADSAFQFPRRPSSSVFYPAVVQAPIRFVRSASVGYRISVKRLQSAALTNRREPSSSRRCLHSVSTRR